MTNIEESFNSDFQEIADQLNKSCQGYMLNDFGSGEYHGWTRHDVQIGVDWCHMKNGKHVMCSNCQNIFFKLYTQMIKRYKLCQRCEQNTVLKLSENGFKYQNYRTIEHIMQNLGVNKCKDCPNIILKIIQD